jgi:hypothetical protein
LLRNAGRIAPDWVAFLLRIRWLLWSGKRTDSFMKIELNASIDLFLWRFRGIVSRGDFEVVGDFLTYDIRITEALVSEP